MDDLERVKNDVSLLVKQLQDMKEDIKRLKTPNFVKRKLDSALSVLLVLIISSKEGTNFFDRIKMFFVTLKNWAKNGFKFEEEKEALRKLEICLACPELKQPQRQCSVCGCMMDKKTKMVGASCPLKKW